VAMKRIKLCLDTSVVSMLDESELGMITKEFFDFVKENQERYELIVSPALFEEIEKANHEIRKMIADFVVSLNATMLPEDNAAYNLAEKYVLEKILSQRHFYDLHHVAYATIYQCDFFISWNRSDLARISTLQKVNLYNIRNNYNPIIIVTPKTFLETKGTEND
jgi:hypothetical protein